MREGDDFLGLPSLSGGVVSGEGQGTLALFFVRDEPALFFIKSSSTDLSHHKMETRAEVREELQFLKGHGRDRIKTDQSKCQFT